MRVKVQTIGQDERSKDVVVELITACGPARLLLDGRQIEKGSVSIGYPLRRDNDLVFIALPRPTQNGSYRVWVRAEDLLPTAA
jgi:hypothetical protein